MPARFNCESSSLKPNGSIRCKTDFVAAHKRATLPVFGGIPAQLKQHSFGLTTKAQSNEKKKFRLPWFLCFLLFIKYCPQHQSMRGRGHTGHAPVAAGQNVFYFRQRNFPLPNLHQGSHDAPTHFVEKAVAFDDERQLRAGLFDVATRQRPHIGFHFVIARAGERLKIVPAQNNFAAARIFTRSSFIGKCQARFAAMDSAPDDSRQNTVLLARRVKRA